MRHLRGPDALKTKRGQDLCLRIFEMLKAGKRAEVAQAQQDILKFVSTQQQLIKAQSNEAIRKSAELTDQIIPASKEQIDTAVLALQNAR